MFNKIKEATRDPLMLHCISNQFLQKTLLKGSDQEIKFYLWRVYPSFMNTKDNPNARVHHGMAVNHNNL